VSLLDIFQRFFKKKVGLALSGGAARGIAHIGVLKVLKKHNIPVDYIAGVSSGALVGSLFAAGMGPEIMEVNSLKMSWFTFMRIAFGKHGPLANDEIKKFVVQNIGDKKFNELAIPFAVACTDIFTGDEVVIDEGKVAPAVATSCAFPGFFQPTPVGGKLLFDGGIVHNLPTSIVKGMGADFVIAVDVVPGGKRKSEPDNPFQVIGRAYDIMVRKMSEADRKAANVLIEPEIPEDIWHIDVDKSKRLIKAGEEAAEKKIPEIKAKLLLN